MVMLIFRGVPIEGVADAVFAIGMSAEIDNFIECPAGNRDPPEPSSPETPAFEFFRGHSGRSSPECAIDPLLPELIFSIKPDAETSPRFHQLGNSIKNFFCVGIVVHHADRKHEIKGLLRKREGLQVRLDEFDRGGIIVGATGYASAVAEGLRLLDGGGVVDPNDVRSRFSDDARVATPATPGIQHIQSRQVRKFDPGFGFKRGPVFFVVSYLIAIPLESEAGEMLVRNKARYSISDRPGIPAG